MAKEFIDDTFMDGFKDGPHVTEVQTGLANQGLYGPDDYVLEGGREAEAQILTNNSIRIFDAVYVLQGRRDVIAANDYTDVSIDNGAQGLNRNDIIVRRYTKDESSEVESTEYAVIKGTAVSGTANDPAVRVGDIRGGATLHEMKLYRVRIEGLNIVAVEPLFQVLYNMSHIKEKLDELNGKMKWKLLQSITGSGVITLPDNYDELLAIAIADSTDNYSKYSVQIPHDLLSAQQEWHRFKAGSYSSTAYNSEAVVRVKEDSMQLASFYINGANRVDTCGLRVYYR